MISCYNLIILLAVRDATGTIPNFLNFTVAALTR